MRSQQENRTAPAPSALEGIELEAAADPMAAAVALKEQAKAGTLASEASSMTVNGERIEYVRPIINLQGHEFIDFKDTRTQLNQWKPERAFIVNGVLLIEEWGISIPVSYVKSIRVDRPAPFSVAKGD